MTKATIFYIIYFCPIVYNLILGLREHWFALVCFGWVLWHINHCRLSNVKSAFYIYIEYIGFGLVGFYGISTIVGYLMSNPLIFIYIYIYICACFGLKHQTALSKQFWCLKNKGLTPEIQWSVLKKSNTPKSFDGRCSLCLEEKIQIMKYPVPEKLLNKRCELIARCRHKVKFKL